MTELLTLGADGVLRSPHAIANPAATATINSAVPVLIVISFIGPFLRVSLGDTPTLSSRAFQPTRHWTPLRITHAAFFPPANRSRRVLASAPFDWPISAAAVLSGPSTL